MDFAKIWEKLKSLPVWARIVVLVAAAFAAFALSSCTRRAYAIRGAAEKVEFEYRDTLYPKTFFR